MKRVKTGEHFPEIELESVNLRVLFNQSFCAPSGYRLIAFGIYERLFLFPISV